MNIINIENVTKVFGDRVLLDKVSLGINEHDKVGIIGVNGTGKSTLVQIFPVLLTQSLNVNMQIFVYPHQLPILWYQVLFR